MWLIDCLMELAFICTWLLRQRYENAYHYCHIFHLLFSWSFRYPSDPTTFFLLILASYDLTKDFNIPGPYIFLCVVGFPLSSLKSSPKHSFHLWSIFLSLSWAFIHLILFILLLCTSFCANSLFFFWILALTIMLILSISVHVIQLLLACIHL